jgi:hypothetical protein
MLEKLGGIVLKRDYVEKLKKIEPNSKARTRVADLASKYLPYIVWENKNLEGDIAIYFMFCHRVARKKSYNKLEDLLEWLKKKNNLSPMQVFKLFAKQLEGVSKPIVKIHI